MLKNRNLQHAQIVRVRLNNFMTFSDEEFQPEQGLNLLLAANGSGKSALSCAICLACGGDPKLSGRAVNPGGYVKEGETEGYIELDLMNDPATCSLITVKRTITAAGKSSWQIGGRRASDDTVRELMSTLNIHVDSLGMYMPQERVGEFVTFKPVRILKEILAVVRDVDLSGKQDEISRSQDRLHDLQVDADKRVIEVDGLTVQVKGMEKLASKQRRKRELLDLIRIYDQLLILLHHRDLQIKRDDVVRQIADIDKKVNDDEGRAVMMDRQIDQYTRRLTGRMDVARSSSSLMSESLSCVNRSCKRYEEIDDEIGLANDKYENQARYRKDLETDISNLKRRRDRLMNDIEAKKDDVIGIERRSNELQRQVIQIREQRSVNGDELDSVECSVKEIDRRLARIKPKPQMMMMDDRVNKLMMDNNRVRSGSGDDVTRLMRYLADHDDGRSVYGPIAKEIANHDDDLVNQVIHHHLSLDMKNSIIAVGPVYEGLRHDMHVELRLNAFGIIKAPKSSSSSSSRPLTMPPSVPGLTIVGWLLDLIVCPDVVKSTIATFTDFRYVLIVRGESSCINQDVMKQIMIGQSISSMTVFCLTRSELIKFKMTKSRYANNYPYSSSVVNQSTYVKPSSSSSVESSSSSVVADEDELNRLGVIITQLTTEKTRLASIEGQYQKEKDTCMRELSSHKQLMSELSTVHTRLTKCERELMMDDDDGDDAKMKKLLADQVSTRLDMSSHHSNWVNLSVRLMIVEETVNDIKTMMMMMKEECTALRSAIKTSRKQLAELTVTRDRLIVDLRLADDEVRLMSDDDRRQCNDIHISLNDCERQLIEMRGESSLISCNDKALDVYERLVNQLAARQTELSNVKREVDQLMKDIDDDLRPWRGEVNDVIQHMNIEYSDNLKYIGFAGRLSLNDDAVNVSLWELNLYFGSDDDHVDKLSSSRNSGGEKAIATSCFMLALQSISSSPWRLVDEINQGLDEVNERRLIHLMVHSVTVKPIQVLFLTPKLPNDCTDLIHPLVTLHTIYNSPTVMCKLSWDLIKQELTQQFPEAMEDFKPRKKAEKEIVQIDDDEE